MLVKMPKIAEKRDIHLRLELDTPELYKDFQTIKEISGIRSNTDLLRYLIKKEALRIKKELGESLDSHVPQD